MSKNLNAETRSLVKRERREKHKRKILLKMKTPDDEYLAGHEEKPLEEIPRRKVRKMQIKPQKPIFPLFLPFPCTLIRSYKEIR